MSEMEATADHVIVIGRGRLIADASIDAFTRQSAATRVRVVSPDADRFVPLLRQAGASVTTAEGVLTVRGMEAACVGKLAGQHRVELHELAPERTSLEAAYMALTGNSIDYRAAEGPGAAASESGTGTLQEAHR
jgi:ABC-2 type transport system ATP-binding protein